MRLLRFRIVALIAAYAVALHVLLLAFAVVAPTNASHVASLCSALTDDHNGAPPGSHEPSCAMACTLLGGNMAASAMSAVVTAAPIVALVLDPVTGAAPSRPAIEGPPRARAPPLV